MSSAPIRSVFSARATPPHGHYSQAVVAQGLVYVSGLLGNSLTEHIDAGRDMRAQTAHCMEQLASILEAAGSQVNLVVKLSVFVSDVDDWEAANEVLAGVFGDHQPARIVVPTGTTLRYGSRIEVDAIAIGEY